MQGRAVLRCFGTRVAELAVNVSCIAVDECHRVCSYLCSDPQRFNGTCAVVAPEATRFYDFDPEALRLEVKVLGGRCHRNPLNIYIYICRVIECY